MEGTPPPKLSGFVYFMTRGTYYKVQGWMILDLKLSGYELIAYAIIYGFSHDGTNRYKSSLRNMGELMTASKSTVQRAISNLEKANLICKEIDFDKENKVAVNYYWANINVLKQIGLENESSDTPIPIDHPYSNRIAPVVIENSPPIPIDHPPLFTQTTNTNTSTNALTNSETNTGGEEFFEQQEYTPPPMPNTILSQMTEYWIKLNPNYKKIATPKIDNPAIRQIAETITGNKMFHLQPEMAMKKWRAFCSVVLTNDFYSQKPLKTICNNIQTFLQDIDKAEKGHYTPPPSKNNSVQAQLIPQKVVLDGKKGYFINNGATIRL